VNCIAVNTENIVNASVANKLLPVKLNKKTNDFLKEHKIMLNSLPQRLNEALIQAHRLIWKRHKLLTHLEVTKCMHNTIIMPCLLSFTSLAKKKNNANSRTAHSIKHMFLFFYNTFHFHKCLPS
jgi:hypothetical protein